MPLGDPHKALLVTDRAIDTDQGEKVVYVVNDDNVAERRPVELRGLHNGLREIASGVRPGERVVVDGIQRVRGGIPVHPTLQQDMPGQGDKGSAGRAGPAGGLAVQPAR